MLSFIGHYLVKNDYGYIATLYLDPQLTELAQEFKKLDRKEKKGLKEAIQFHLQNKLEEKDIIMVKIMLGSLLIASLPLMNNTFTEQLELKKELPQEIINNKKNNSKQEELEKEIREQVKKENLLLVNKNKSLSQDYTPQNLVIPDVPFPFTEFHQKKLMDLEAVKALEDLFAKAKQDNINLYAVSGYRSYDRQETIFNSQVERYGLSKANQVSARPGESEHQTGLAMDVTSPKVNFELVQNFGATKEGQWLKDNASKFGFIIRYPQGKEEITGYQYEPWHLRYVGREVAQQIAVNDLTLEEYLG